MDAVWTDADDAAVRRLLAGYDRADDAVVMDAQPLPDPLDRVIAWLDEQEAAGYRFTIYPTHVIAMGIDHPDPVDLSRRLCDVTGDWTIRNGYSVAGLREAAARIRFAL